MSFKELDTVVLNRDLPEHGLKRGDLGAVVMAYGADGLEVEFVLPTGGHQALLTLGVNDVRALNADDMFAVRPLRRSA